MSTATLLDRGDYSGVYAWRGIGMGAKQKSPAARNLKTRRESERAYVDVILRLSPLEMLGLLTASCARGVTPQELALKAIREAVKPVAERGERKQP